MCRGSSTEGVLWGGLVWSGICGSAGDGDDAGGWAGVVLGGGSRMRGMGSASVT